MTLLGTHMSRREIPYIIATALLGTLSHFFYEWSGHMALIALFSPVNESAWEHLKLLFFPFLAVSILQYLLNRRSLLAARFFFYRFWSALCAMAVILICFFTYTGIFGTHFLPLDILIYFTGVLTAFLLSERFLGSVQKSVPDFTVTVLLWSALCLCFFLFTCFPPEIPLFFSPAG